jgi:AcrR family transcriptional regulator
VATQEERRAVTRAALVEGALACLVPRGVAGTTTAAVCARAGVSSGALFNHFPSKPALLGAAAEQVLAAATTDYVARFTDGAATSGDVLGDAVRLLWQIHAEPRLSAVLELFVAARTDTDLAAALQSVNEPHTARVLDVARQLLPGYAGHPEFEAMFDLVISAVVGVALGLHADAQRKGRVETLVAVVRAQLDSPPPQH